MMPRKNETRIFYLAIYVKYIKNRTYLTLINIGKEDSSGEIQARILKNE